MPRKPKLHKAGAPSQRRRLTKRDIADLQRIRGKLTQEEFAALVADLYSSAAPQRKAKGLWTPGNLMAHWIQIELRRRRSKLTASATANWLARELSENTGRKTSGRTLQEMYRQAQQMLDEDPKMKSHAETVVATIQSLTAGAEQHVVIPGLLAPVADKLGK
jgi:hypothetical protein